MRNGASSFTTVEGGSTVIRAPLLLLEGSLATWSGVETKLAKALDTPEALHQLAIYYAEEWPLPAGLLKLAQSEGVAESVLDAGGDDLEEDYGFRRAVIAFAKMDLPRRLKKIKKGARLQNKSRQFLLRRKLFLRAGQTANLSNLGVHWTYLKDWKVVGSGQLAGQRTVYVEADVPLDAINYSRWVRNILTGYEEEGEVPLLPSKRLKVRVSDGGEESFGNGKT